MKVRIKKTNEIVNVANYAEIELEQCDSYGDPLRLSLDDVEFIQEIPEDEHWRDARERAAIAAMQGMLSNPELVDSYNRDYRISIERAAVGYADLLVELLKKKKK